MIKRLDKNIFQMLASYLVLNSTAVESSGLNGKAGFSICLFELSRLLHDTGLEDKAYQLLLQASISQSDNITFEQGLAGIGYAILYLKKRQFIDADFREIFAKQDWVIHNKLKQLTTCSTHPSILEHLVTINQYARIRKSEELNIILSKLNLEFIHRYTQQWQQISTANLDLYDYLTRWNRFLFAIHNLDFILPLSSAIRAYFQTYATGRIAYDYETFFYLGSIILKLNDKQLEYEYKQILRKQFFPMPQFTMPWRAQLLWGLKHSNNYAVKKWVKDFSQLTREQVESFINNIYVDINEDFFSFSQGLQKFLLFMTAVCQSSKERTEITHWFC